MFSLMTNEIVDIANTEQLVICSNSDTSNSWRDDWALSSKFRKWRKHFFLILMEVLLRLGLTVSEGYL